MDKMKIGKFLSKYYNIQGSNTNDLTHEQMIEMFDVEPCFGCDISISDISQGKVILVEDVDKYILGYKNPFIYLDEEECEKYFEHPIIAEFYKSIERETGLKKADVEHLKIYELEELLKKYKKLDDNQSKNVVVRELKKRKFSDNNTKDEKLEKVRKREYRKEMIK